METRPTKTRTPKHYSSDMRSSRLFKPHKLVVVAGKYSIDWGNNVENKSEPTPPQPQVMDEKKNNAPIVLPTVAKRCGGLCG